MKAATEQVVSYLGEWLDQASKSQQTLSGAIGAIGGELEDTTTVETLSQGLAKQVKAECWCAAEKVESPDGTRHVVRVLAFFPNSERVGAMKLQLTNLMEILKAKGQLTPEREQALRTAIAELK